jgi:hypothetical protein
LWSRLLGSLLVAVLAFVVVKVVLWPAPDNKSVPLPGLTMPASIANDLSSAEAELSSAVAILPTVAGANADGPNTVVYTLSGQVADNIEYAVPGTAQEAQLADRTSLPWSKSFTVPAGTTYFSTNITAQNAGSGTIACSISVNGKVVATQSASGAHVPVTCFGG